MFSFDPTYFRVKSCLSFFLTHNNRADVDHFYDAGENVIAQGFYHGTYGATGKSFTASFAHIYQLRAGKIVKFVQVVDSAKVLEAMQD